MTRQINFNPLKDKLNEVLFNVELQPVYSDFKNHQTGKTEKIPIPGYQAIMNQNTGRIISIVGDNYQLITNKEALERGKNVFLQLYPSLKKEELIPFNVVAPSTLSSVHIDLIHKDVNFKVWEQETWLPFLRVTNSYNRTHALSFEIGFVKELCSNGALFKKDTMKLKYIHDRSNRIKLQSDLENIVNVEKIFTEQCKRLREVIIPPDKMFPLICHILKLKINVPEKQRKSKIDQLNRLYNEVFDLGRQYVSNSEYNAYTAFNIATDIVSHHDDHKILQGYYFNVRSFFTRPTVWMNEFTEKIKANNFHLDEYIYPIKKDIKAFSKGATFKWN
jgi:hypothetical protein